MSRARALAAQLTSLPRIPLPRNALPRNALPRRAFATASPRRQGQYFRGLEAMHVKKPWLQALNDKRSGVSIHDRPLEKRALTPKRMGDSYHELTLPLANDEWLVDSYVNASGQLRLGSLFQDLDALAGVIAYKHTGTGPALVTAAVDRISIINPLAEFCDLQLSGFVSYVGTSSMEISMEARRVDRATDKPVPGHEGLLLTCAFTFVALDPGTKKAVPVNPLLLETPEEKEIFRRAEAYKNAKKALAKTDLAKQTPNDEESDLIHQMWISQQAYEDPQTPAQLPSDTAYMSATTISSTSIMQPQYRNRHSFMIFGGYLLKCTMELAFCCCSAFAHARPTFVSLDPSTFQAPVPVGSILYLNATVAYTEEANGREEGAAGGAGQTVEGSRVQVRVESSVRDVEHGNVTETGVFNYTFWVRAKRRVLPVAYGEYVKFVEARRRAKQQKMVLGADDGTASRVTE